MIRGGEGTSKKMQTVVRGKILEMKKRKETNLAEENALSR